MTNKLKFSDKTIVAVANKGDGMLVQSGSSPTKQWEAKGLDQAELERWGHHPE